MATSYPCKRSPVNLPKSSAPPSRGPVPASESSRKSSLAMPRLCSRIQPRRGRIDPGRVPPASPWPGRPDLTRHGLGGRIEPGPPSSLALAPAPNSNPAAGSNRAASLKASPWRRRTSPPPKLLLPYAVRKKSHCRRRGGGGRRRVGGERASRADGGGYGRGFGRESDGIDDDDDGGGRRQPEASAGVAVKAAIAVSLVVG
eukprot:2042_1